MITITITVMVMIMIITVVFIYRQCPLLDDKRQNDTHYERPRERCNSRKLPPKNLSASNAETVYRNNV